MNRPSLEMADLVRSASRNFIERNRSWLNQLHLKVLTAIERCRTAALGGHLDECVRCGHRAISFNSCRNRHCPKCQANARDRWLEARQRELLPTRYVHVVFTLPHELAPLALQNKRVVYDLLFRISAETLLEIARDRSIWEQTSDSSVCCTAGIRSSNIIPISTVSCRLADYRRITHDGFRPSESSSFRSTCWQKSSEVSSPKR
jgi:hypothetical protein